MNTTVIFVGVVVLAFVGGGALSRYATRLHRLGGIEYLLLGAVIGPHALGWLSSDALESLDLFVSFVLGVIGFLVALGLRRVRGGFEIALAGAVIAILVAASVGGAAIGVVQAIDPALLQVGDPVAAVPLLSDGDYLVSLWLAPDALWIGLAVGAAAAVSSVTLLEIAAVHARGSRGWLDALHGLAAVGQATAILLFGVAMAGVRASDTAGALGLTLTEWGGITIIAGVVTGIMFTVFIGRDDDPLRLLVATVGVVTFCAGIGVALGVSPLVVNLIAGAMVALTSPHAELLDRALDRLRFPTRVLVLLLAGAYWVPMPLPAWPLPIGYALLRLAALRVSSRLAAATFLPASGLGVRLGVGLGAQGALAAAIAFNFAQRLPEIAGPVTNTVLGGLVLTALFIPRAAHRYLIDQGALTADDPPASSSTSTASASTRRERV